MTSAIRQAVGIPQKIRSQRERMGMTRAALARKADVSVTTVENAETRGHLVSVSTLVSLTAALGGEVVIQFPEATE